jgi:hypothetical protein
MLRFRDALAMAASAIRRGASEGESHRPGLLQCNDCLQAFTVTVKSVMESSHLPLTNWAMAFHKMAASKKGISAKQMQRELGLKSYRTAWFLCMRIREAMSLPRMPMGRLGGEGKVLESDETFVGGKAKTAGVPRRPANFSRSPTPASRFPRSTPCMLWLSVAARYAPPMCRT